MGIHGMYAQNEHGIMLSADLKNYVFSGYYPASAPVGSLFYFDVAGGPLSMYGIRLPVGGSGSIISVVATAGGYRVTVMGVSVIGLLVFSPISGGGKSGFGFALFDSTGQCTFDSNQKHLVASASGALSVGGTINSKDDVVIFIGTGIHPTILPTSSVVVLCQFANVESGAFVYYRATALDTYVQWNVKRPVALRGASGYSGQLAQQTSGYYHLLSDFRYYVSPRYGGWSNNPSYYQVAGYTANSTAGIQAANTIASISSQNVGSMTQNNQYPYTENSYNTTQNLALVTKSSLYL